MWLNSRPRSEASRDRRLGEAAALGISLENVALRITARSARIAVVVSPAESNADTSAFRKAISSGFNVSGAPSAMIGSRLKSRSDKGPFGANDCLARPKMLWTQIGYQRRNPRILFLLFQALGTPLGVRLGTDQPLQSQDSQLFLPHLSNSGPADRANMCRQGARRRWEHAARPAEAASLTGQSETSGDRAPKPSRYLARIETGVDPGW